MDLYKRICVKGLECASGPMFPGPMFYDGFEYDGHDVFNFILYNDTWYQIKPNTFDYIINELVRCEYGYEIYFTVKRFIDDQLIYLYAIT